MPNEYVVAVVQSICDGKHGKPYAVASSEAIKGSITFSLDSETWKEPEPPEKGTYVVLYGLRRKRAGWRAKSARLFNPQDEGELSK